MRYLNQSAVFLVTPSDIVIVQSDVKTILSNITSFRSDIVAQEQSDIVTILSNLTSLRSDILVTTDSNIVVVQSDLTVADALIDTIKSDLIISQSDLKIVQIRGINQATVTLVAANFTGTTTRFTIANGPILVRHLGLLITTQPSAGANTLGFSFTPTGGGATNLSGVTDTAAATAQTLFVVDGVKATGLVKCTDVGIMVTANEHMPIILSSGVVQTIFSAGPPAQGAGVIFMQYEKLNIAATVV